jgi:hypothetical protein
MVYDAIREHGSLCGDSDYAKEMLGRAVFTKKFSATEIPLVWRVSSPDAAINAIFSGTVRAAAVLKRQKPEDMERVQTYLRERY